MRELLEASRQKTFLEGMNETRKEFHYKYTRALRKAFREESLPLFQDHPILLNFAWGQGSFPENDYEFFVNRLDYTINGVSTDEINTDHELYSALKDINEFLDVFSDEEFQLLFGDHAAVQVTEHTMEISFFDVDPQ